MREPLRSAGAALRRWQDAAASAPKVAVAAVRNGILPVGVSTLFILKREGLSDLHWKVLGDSLVRFFQGSGPFLTKLGQILATRNDLLPEAVCIRLEALYTGQAPMPKRTLRSLLRKAYPRGSPFRDFENAPIAVGSIGQVHRARLQDGRRVVVKVLLPGIEKAIRRDLNAARVLVDLFFGAVARANRSTRLLVQRALEDLSKGFEVELNLENEASAFEEFRKRLRRNPRIYVPRCYRKWSSRNILVLEELTGQPLSAVRERSASDPGTAKRAADLALREILRQVFQDGRFHGDPHGGNLLILEDGRLGLIDLGLTGELKDRDRRNITRAVRAFLAGDGDGATRALLEFGTLPPDFDLAAFKSEIAQALQDDSRHLEQLVNDLFRVAHRHCIYLPPSTTLLIKTLVTIEGVARSLDPSINLVATAAPIILKSLAPQWMRWSYWKGSGDDRRSKK
jgi:ubiquinone biosynthesis protein